MDLHAVIGNGRRLRRIIALLAALAVLAERAAGRSLPVRMPVLWLLRRAEQVAGTFVFDTIGPMPSPAAGGFEAVGNGATDALRLAARFRALASALAILLPLVLRSGRRPAPRRFAFDPAGIGFFDVAAPRSHDTS